MAELNKTTEYINKVEVLKLVEKYALTLSCHGSRIGVMDWLMNEIKEIPPADVAPVIHARWIKHKIDKYDFTLHCSNCAWIDEINSEWGKYKYCPNCGAKMDENENEE